MRKFLIPLLLITILAGCRKESDALFIKGHIKGIGNDTIYLYNIDNRRDVIDTILVLNDDFVYPIEIDTTSSNILLFSDGTEFPLFLEKNTSIDIQGDSATLNRLIIDGGVANSVYGQFLDSLAVADSTGKSIQRVATDFIRNNNTSTVSIYLINKYFLLTEKPNLVEVKRMIESLSGTLQDDQRIMDINDFLLQREKSTVGKTAPFFSLNNSNNEKITRADNFKDQFVVINFWSTWSQDSASVNQQQMRDLYRKYRKNKEVGLLSISFDMNKEDWLKAIKNDTLKWEQVSDFAGLNSPLITNFMITELPTTILLGKNGRILARDLPVDSIGKLLETEIKKEAEKAKAKKK